MSLSTPTPTPTPWRSPALLLALRAQLYPSPHSTLDERHQGIATIQSWRAHGPLPPPLEATAQLADAQLHDTPAASALSIGAAYGSACARFVTALLDGAQRGRARQSMRSLAAKVGLPEEFVRVRHAVIHDAMPALEELRRVAREALAWIWERYWRRVGEGREVGEEVAALVRRYKRERVGVVRGGGSGGGEEAGRRCRKLVRECGDVAARAVVRVLVMERFMVPAGRRLGDGMRTAFFLWDDFLRLQSGSLAFRACLMDRLVAGICVPAEEGSVETTCEALYLWICHILGQEWGREFAGEEALDVVVKKCLFCRSTWGLRLAEEILGENPKLAQEYGEMLEEAKAFLMDVGDVNSGDADDSSSLPSEIGEEELRLLQEGDDEDLLTQLTRTWSPEPVDME
ncbi:MAG: rRNA-processing protein las1 [Trizodia sp. TS-e1964]|nr:MAG: rRNA-processing protein las1 [Trizodia sp. TS-e1964]